MQCRTTPASAVQVTAVKAAPKSVVRPRAVEFTAQIQFPGCLKSVVAGALDVDRQMLIQVCDGTQAAHRGFRGVVVEAIDSKRVSMVVAYVSAVVDISGDRARACFWISAATLHTCLKSVTASQAVHLTRYASGNEFELHELELRTREPRPSTGSTSFRIATLAQEAEPMCVEDMPFDYAVESEMGMLRAVVKTAKDLDAEYVRIQVVEQGRTPKVVMSFDGLAAVNRTFDTVSRTAETAPAETAPAEAATAEAATAEAATAEAADHVTFDQEFCTDHLHMFLKALDKTTVALRLGQNMPLAMSYTLGEPDSTMNFFLSPRCT
jgi:hypothetical protein